MTPKSPVLTRSMQTRITRITREQIDAPTICHDEHRTAHRHGVTECPAGYGNPCGRLTPRHDSVGVSASESLADCVGSVQMQGVELVAEVERFGR